MLNNVVIVNNEIRIFTENVLMKRRRGSGAISALELAQHGANIHLLWI